MASMVKEAKLKPTDYIAVLPMSSAETDTSFFYFVKSLAPVCKNAIVNLNFNSADVTNKRRLDSLKSARLIFVTGGDQSRFMRIVLNTPVYEAIHFAFDHGAMVAGSSAGAAVMSEHMITGRAFNRSAAGITDTVTGETVKTVRADNLEFTSGLGLVTKAIIDQHFIVRSRYNRLLSALQAHPDKYCIGVDESTGILVKGNEVQVFGEGQVVVFSKPEGMNVTGKGLIRFSDLRMQVLTAGDKFEIK